MAQVLVTEIATTTADTMTDGAKRTTDGILTTVIVEEEIMNEGATMVAGTATETTDATTLAPADRIATESETHTGNENGTGNAMRALVRRVGWRPLMDATSRTVHPQRRNPTTQRRTRQNRTSTLRAFSRLRRRLSRT